MYSLDTFCTLPKYTLTKISTHKIGKLDNHKNLTFLKSLTDYYNK